MITFNEFLEQYMLRNISTDKLIAGISSLSPIFNRIQIENGDKYIKILKKFHEHVYGKHFNEYFATEQVKCMYHTKPNGRICKGEKFDVKEAEIILNKYIKPIDNTVNIWDVYVALNAQYHDHIVEFIEWFKTIDEDELHDKVVESTINFWFKDEDAGSDKVWNYFKNIG